MAIYGGIMVRADQVEGALPDEGIVFLNWQGFQETVRRQFCPAQANLQWNDRVRYDCRRALAADQCNIR